MLKYSSLILFYLLLFLDLPAQFGPKILVDSSNFVSDVFAVDLNGDSLKDIVICERFLANRVGYSLNLGGGLMDTVVEIDSMYQPFEIDAGDMNGQGGPDLVVIQGNHPKGLLQVMENNFPSFPPTVIDSVAYVIDFRLADLDGNGSTDIVVAGGTSLLVYFNNGFPNFTKTVIPMASNENYALEVADLNNDNRPELILGADGLYIYGNNNGVITFDSATTSTLSAGSGSIFELATGDLNNDGFTDIVYAQSPLVIADTNQNGSFGFNSVIDSGGIKHNLVLKDFDGDGRLDYLAHRAITHEVFWRPQASPGIFGPQMVIHQGNFRGTRVFSDDLNNDGKPDVIWCNELAYHLNLCLVGIAAAFPVNSLNCYPSPNSGQFNIDFPEAGRLRVYDMSGQVVFYTEVAAKGSEKLDLQLAGGIYGLEFVGISGNRYAGKVWLGR